MVPGLAVDPHVTAKLADWLAKGERVVVVRVTSVKGSAPRESDALMGVTARAMAGTIGGGQLEWLALEHARKMLAGGTGPVWEYHFDEEVVTVQFRDGLVVDVQD